MDMKRVTLYGAIIISSLIIIGCIVHIFLAYQTKDLESIKDWKNTLQNALMVVLAFWVGSSATGRLKDEVIAGRILPPNNDDVLNLTKPVPNFSKTPQ